MRQADRREELEKRKKKLEEKEARKAINRRKRDEAEDKDRRVKQKLLQERKISLEDTWGKVRASQPRLNRFFMAPSVPAQPPSSSADSPEPPQEPELGSAQLSAASPWIVFEPEPPFR